MTQSNNAAKDQYVVPDCENLKNLGPGCFVRIVCQSKNMWVEITAADGAQLKGVAHPELDDGGLAIAADTPVKLQAEQINALGCDRYCYCD